MLSALLRFFQTDSEWSAECILSGNQVKFDCMWDCVAFIAFVDIVWISTEMRDA